MPLLGGTGGQEKRPRYTAQEGWNYTVHFFSPPVLAQCRNCTIEERTRRAGAALIFAFPVEAGK
ncbi:unnamed protein product [Amoebophrya sp. A120]|nr:unnamed protein product [Amoebophrya sp. A120]|eukprot:GSA120T00024846001.1